MEPFAARDFQDERPDVKAGDHQAEHREVGIAERGPGHRQPGKDCEQHSAGPLRFDQAPGERRQWGCGHEAEMPR